VVADRQGGPPSPGFLVVDTTFFAANLTKVLEGGYVPLILAGLVYFVMVCGMSARRRSRCDYRKPSCRWANS
jgi:K+ transporter